MLEGNKTEKWNRYDTTAGRAILSSILPQGLPFSLIDRPLKKKAISQLINVAFRQLGLRETVLFADRLLYTGFISLHVVAFPLLWMILRYLQKKKPFFKKPPSKLKKLKSNIFLALSPKVNAITKWSIFGGGQAISLPRP